MFITAIIQTNGAEKLSTVIGYYKTVKQLSVDLYVVNITAVINNHGICLESRVGLKR